MRLLLTGALGFVAPYVLDAVRQAAGPAIEVLATSREGTEMPDGTPTTALDITDAAAMAATVRDFAPSHVAHLAGVTTLANAAADPDGAWRINLLGTLNIARAMKAQAPGGMMLFAGSGQAYGETARERSPLTEADPMAPNSDYAATKAAADLALGAMADARLKVLRMRPFNHTGPEQPPSFVIPSFADQIARIEAGRQAPELAVGNLDVTRDFLDVRDVAACYALALMAAPRLPASSIYNVASGKAPSVRAMLQTLADAARVPITVTTDPARVRAGEIETFVGSPAKAEAELGWRPAIDFNTTLLAILAAARRRHGVG